MKGNVMKAITVAAVAVLLFSQPASATSFAPYQEQCIPDPTGQYYVVTKRKDDGKQTFPYGAVSLTIAERRMGSPPVQPRTAGEGTARGTFLATVDPAIRVRDGDIVHGRIDLDQPPGDILVSSTGKGIVILRHGESGLDSTFRLSVGIGLLLTFILTVIVAGYMANGPSHLVGGNESDAEGAPLMGWARDGGDLRVAHFFATHSMHFIPAFGFAASMLLPPYAGRMAVLAFSVVFTALVGYAFAEALMGRPFLPMLP